MTDMERLIAAADALADAIETIAAGEVPNSKRFYHWHDKYTDARLFALAAANEYRAARESITRGTPPAFATSA